MRKIKINIPLQVSEGELRHLIEMHASLIRDALWREETQYRVQESGERMSALLEILKKSRPASMG